MVSTVWGWGSGDQPNDWLGSQNKNLIGGAGGSGNYRGGSGGAGFCGGSGGVMSNIVLASGVGGGGGGSSFVAIADDLFRLNVDVEKDRDFMVNETGPDFAVFPALDKSVTSWKPLYKAAPNTLDKESFKYEVFNFIFNV